MSQILSGRINLSKIPEGLLKYNNKGEAFVWVDVSERREPGQYGDTHSISIYNSATREKIYIGDLRPKEIGGDSAPVASGPSAFPPRPAAPKIITRIEDIYPDDKPAPAAPAPRPMNTARMESDPAAGPDDDLADLPF